MLQLKLYLNYLEDLVVFYIITNRNKYSHKNQNVKTFMQDKR